MQKVYIYIDECGTPSLELEKKGVLSYMVYCAVILEENSIIKAKNLLSQIISDNHIQQGYLKSSNISNDEKGFNKRVNILTALKSLEHYVVALVIDKSKIDKESGLQYKQSYIKYFQRFLTKQFLQRYDEFHIIFDKLGRKDFQESLDMYMQKSGGIGRTLFSNNSFTLADDISEEPLLQLADFYAGTINKYFCQKYDSSQAKCIHDNYLRGKVTYEWFPSNSITLVAAENIFNDVFDKELYEIAINTAKRYIHEHEHGDVEGVELIKFLLQESTINPLRVISSKEIKQHLLKRGYEIGDPINKISELRSNEVIIISPLGKKGYKFPTSQKELSEYFDRLRVNVIPQLRRGHIIDKVLCEKSLGKYGILHHIEYDTLNKLCEIVNNEI